jgi:hypothetical protein
MIVENNIPEEVNDVNFIREGLKIGLINGAFALLIMYTTYYMGLDTYVNVQMYANFVPYMIIILIVYGLQLRKRAGGFLAFKEAIQFTFFSYVIAAVVIAIGTYVLYNIIDKDLTQKSFQLGLEKTRSFMQRMGAPQEEIDKALENAKKGPGDTGLGTILMGTGMGLIWDFVKSLLISLIIKKEKPFLG